MSFRHVFSPHVTTPRDVIAGLVPAISIRRARRFDNWRTVSHVGNAWDKMVHDPWDGTVPRLSRLPGQARQ
jgi:hypothetical protein